MAEKKNVLDRSTTVIEVVIFYEHKPVCELEGEGFSRSDFTFLLQLWALLHFIMPTLFDSHEEFNEWFSKDIESHAENKSAIDESKYLFLKWSF